MLAIAIWCPVCNQIQEMNKSKRNKKENIIYVHCSVCGHRLTLKEEKKNER